MEPTTLQERENFDRGIAIATQMPLVYLHITEVPCQDASGLDVVSTPHTDSPVM